MELFEVNSRDVVQENDSRVQRLFEPHHFHYPYIELGLVEIHIVPFRSTEENASIICTLTIDSNGTTWTTNRTLNELIQFDFLLHRCVFERRFSKLDEVSHNSTAPFAQLEHQLSLYACRLTQVFRLQPLTCNSLLEFLEMDYRGNHFKSIDENSINLPAIAAAIVTKPYVSNKRNHLQLKVGDMIAINEMLSQDQDEKTLWKGKLTISARSNSTCCKKTLDLEVGYFPSDCVRLINKNRLHAFIPINGKKYGLRRPISRRARVSNVIRDVIRKRDPIFGMDLTEHLHKTERDVPFILEQCAEAIEKLGLVTGIYRQCGVQSNIKRLRTKYDSGDHPDLIQFGSSDIYSVSSLLKQYFRQLPIPLFTSEFCNEILMKFQFTDKAVSEDEMKLALQQLPITHFTTARYLMLHLNKLLEYSTLTDMTVKALSIVWAPNLYRGSTTDLNQESDLLNSLSAHTNLCCYMITNARVLFSSELREAFLMNVQSCSQGVNDSSFGNLRMPKALQFKNIWLTNMLSSRFEALTSSQAACWKDHTGIDSDHDQKNTTKGESLRLFILKGVDDLRERLQFLTTKESEFRNLPLRSTASNSHASIVASVAASSESEDTVKETINTQSTASTLCSSLNSPNKLSERSQGRRISFSTTGNHNYDKLTPRWTESYVVESESDSDSDGRESPTLEMSRYDNVDLVVARKYLRRPY